MDSFLKAYLRSQSTGNPQVMSLSTEGILKLSDILNEHVAKIAIVRPIDNDPLYKVLQGGNRSTHANGGWRPCAN